MSPSLLNTTTQEHENEIMWILINGSSLERNHEDTAAILPIRIRIFDRFRDMNIFFDESQLAYRVAS